jgi:hypothetical protein
MSDAIVGAVFGSTPHFASMAGTVYRITPESSGLLETYYQNIHDDLTVIIPTSSAGVSHDLSTYWTSDNVRGISASTDPSTMAEHLLLALPEERTKSLPITISCVHFPNAGDSVPMNVLKKALESAGINDDQLSDNDILAFVSMAQSVSLTEGQFLNGPGGKLQQPLIVLLLKGTLASEMDRIWPAGSLLVTDPAFFDGSASSNVAPLFATEPTEALVMKKQWFEAAFKPGRDLPYRVMLALVQKMVVTLSRSGAIT